jgi:hypothetical protein
VNRDYDLFEHFPDDSLIWRGQVSGLRNVGLKLQEIAEATTNECFAMHLATRQIVARLNFCMYPRVDRKPVVFQIAYDEGPALARADLLRGRGYEVGTVMGNEAAKVVLSLPQCCDIFIIGHQAPLESRRQMVAWLKAKYPAVPVLALNMSDAQELSGADYNAAPNSPQAWLSIVAGALG